MSKSVTFLFFIKGMYWLRIELSFCFRRGIFCSVLVARSSWETLVYLRVSLIRVIGNVRGTHLLEHLAGKCGGNQFEFTSHVGDPPFLL